MEKSNCEIIENMKKILTKERNNAQEQIFIKFMSQLVDKPCGKCLDKRWEELVLELEFLEEVQMINNIATQVFNDGKRENNT